MSVELNIKEYDLEGAADCHYDYLEVYSVTHLLGDNLLLA